MYTYSGLGQLVIIMSKIKDKTINRKDINIHLFCRNLRRGGTVDFMSANVGRAFYLGL